MIVEILFMMKKKGCDYMFKKLVMLLCFGILLSFNVANAQTNDELPPLVIETDDVKYAGINIDWTKSPSVIIKKDVILYKEPSLNSAVVGKILADEKAKDMANPYLSSDMLIPVVKAKAYIYPRMGKTEIISPIKETYEYKIKENTPKTGDFIYIIYKEPTGAAIAWYNNEFIKLPSKGVKTPDMDNNFNDYIYAVYEGYFSKYDYDGNPRAIVDMVYVDRKYYVINYPRRNADVWLYLKKTDELQGWVQLTNAYSGFKQQPDWWRYFNAVDLGISW